jgi:hypothetical protein
MSNGHDNTPPTLWPGDPPNGIPITRPDDDGVDQDAGFVHRGTKHNDKAHIYMWFTQSRQSQKHACDEDAIYSFQQPTATLTTSMGTWDVTGKIKKIVEKHPDAAKSTIGGLIVWGEPAPDYQVDWVKKENEKRKKRGKKPFPPVKRPGARPGEKEGYPYEPRKIPGVPDDGFDDAPDFTAFDGAVILPLMRKSKDDPKNPPGYPTVPDNPTLVGNFQATLTIRVHYTTLLYCLDPPGCLGMFEWDFVETDVFTITAAARLPGGDLEMVSIPESSDKVITMGPWTTC